MSAPTELDSLTGRCQCGHPEQEHELISRHGDKGRCLNWRCFHGYQGANCMKFTARGLPPESQGEALSPEDEENLLRCLDIITQEGKANSSLFQRRLRIGHERAARVMAALEKRGYLGPYEGVPERVILKRLVSPAPQPAEPCAQGAEGEDLRMYGLVTAEITERFGLRCLPMQAARFASEKYEQLQQTAAAKDARIAELEAELKTERYLAEAIQRAVQSASPCGHNNGYLFSPDGKGIHIYCTVCRIEKLSAQLSEVTRERDALDEMLKSEQAAFLTASEALAASETDRERLRAALGIASNVFDEMDAVVWDDDSGWQSSSYEDAKDAVNAALATEGEAKPSTEESQP